MKYLVIMVAALKITLLLAVPAVATASIGMEKQSDTVFSLAVSDLSTARLIASQTLEVDGLDLLNMDGLGRAEDSLLGELDGVLLIEPPWDMNLLEVQFQCATHSAHIAGIKPAPVDQVLAYKDLFAGIGTDFDSFTSLDEARLEAARRLPRDTHHESGYLLYERKDGRVGISELLSGTAHSLDPIKLASLGGRTVTMKGAHGVDGNYPVLEIVHTHPPHSTHMHSGGRGQGDVYVAESLGVNVSVVYSNRVYLYQPQGRSIARRLHQVRGELVAMLDGH